MLIHVTLNVGGESSGVVRGVNMGWEGDVTMLGFVPSKTPSLAKSKA
jgi:hypothetical protein